ncbi:MAG: HEAT repeat domain-containing protein, partial [Planctomycetota bacterium]|nr:HEAT repeat domain-containing protein [Planctomycetota bacterium]
MVWRVWLGVLSAMLSAGYASAGDLSVLVSMEARWWNEHEFGWRLGEAAGLRWAITDGIVGRGRVGGENVPAGKLAEDFEKQTGIRAEVIGGVLVLHRPDEARRKGLEGRLAGGGEGAVEAAWRLGWLKDALAWPALARAVAGKDTAAALAAAVALRRLDGEEPLDMRRWIITGLVGAATIHGKTPPNDGLWQLPLGAVFRDAVAATDLEAVAGSPWVPLREAAARLAPGSTGGKALAERLLKDPSLCVRQAAERALRTWQAPAGGFKPVQRPVLKCDLAAQWNTLNTRGDGGARAAGPWIAAFGSDEDITKLFDTATTTSSPHVAMALFEALCGNVGGPAGVGGFRKLAASGKSVQYGRYGLAMTLDGEALARELGPLLGSDNNVLVSEFLLARFAGPPALPHLEKAMAAVPDKVGHVAPLALGFIGGPGTVGPLAKYLESPDLSTALAAARGLGDTGLAAAVAPLVKALSSPNRVIRSRAALALGRIGGPEAASTLAAMLKTEKEYLPKRSACAMLKEIASGDKAHAEAIAAAEKELAAFAPAFGPVNPQFAAGFPTGKWTPVGEPRKVGPGGEVRIAVDGFCGLLVVYGGCGSRGYNNECAGFDVASGKWFWIRPWENLGLFYNESRASMG